MENLPRHVFSRISTSITSFARRNVVPCLGVPFSGLCCFMYSMDFDGRWERRNSEAKNDIKESSEVLSSLRKKRTELEVGIERLQEEIRNGGETGMVGKESGSIEFDRDDELFATAGVSRRIKIFGFSLEVVNEPTDVHPVVEVATRSKLSYLSRNRFTKSQIASSDYEGKSNCLGCIYTADPSMLVSGSDDCKVLTFNGHTNEKNFVGLTVNKEFLACGSESNEVVVYHKTRGSHITDEEVAQFGMNNDKYMINQLAEMFTNYIAKGADFEAVRKAGLRNMLYAWHKNGPLTYLNRNAYFW
ncbi:E3 ubiquitin-protein ligase COP1 [Striga hermonthica]|uniref:E3 ubiquitin-protein ligase COP1 n=1 Tax=Striga hermonthica TaxID=68872 RepID=A0A9N7N1Q9_STRHE|nr:E3 ubiquitin-protein ligase COP1 [Striga hermonthica]